MTRTDRGALQLVDIVLSFVVLVAILATAPFQYKFINMVGSEADPFTALLLQLGCFGNDCLSHR